MKLLKVFVVCCLALLVIAPWVLPRKRQRRQDLDSVTPWTPDGSDSPASEHGHGGDHGGFDGGHAGGDGGGASH